MVDCSLEIPSCPIPKSTPPNTMDINLSVHFFERLQELPSYLGLAGETFFQALDLPEGKSLETMTLAQAYQVLAQYPLANPQWLFMGFGKPLLHGQEAEDGGGTLLQHLETQAVMLELNHRRMKELEQTIQEQAVALLRAQAGKEALMETFRLIAPEKGSLSPEQYQALLERLLRHEQAAP